jgi:hypothetical protein
LKHLISAMFIAVGVLGVSAATAATDFFATISEHCGQSFVGEVVNYNESDTSWRNARIVMHIRDCSDKEIKIPLHVDENRSRTWVISKTGGAGLRLKHDHRHENGHSDEVTMYGGDGVDTGDAIVAFPVDDESIELFKKTGLTASVTNIWHVGVEGNIFSYRLTRENRDFKVDFDLTQPVTTPPPAWDKVGH